MNFINLVEGIDIFVGGGLYSMPVFFDVRLMTLGLQEEREKNQILRCEE